MKAGFKNLFGAAWARHTAFWIAILTMANLAFGQSSKMSPDLQALDPNSNVNVIVQYYNPPNGNELNAGGLIGATNGKSLGLVKAYSWRLRSHVGAMPPTKKPRARKSNPGCVQRVQHDGTGGLPFPTRLRRSECARTFSVAKDHHHDLFDLAQGRPL